MVILLKSPPIVVFLKEIFHLTWF